MIRKSILVIAKDKSQAELIWKNIREGFGAEFRPIIASAKEYRLDGLRPDLIVLCGGYELNPVYKSSGYRALLMMDPVVLKLQDKEN